MTGYVPAPPVPVEELRAGDWLPGHGLVTKVHVTSDGSVLARTRHYTQPPGLTAPHTFTPGSLIRVVRQ